MAFIGSSPTEERHQEAVFVLGWALSRVGEDRAGCLPTGAASELAHASSLPCQPAQGSGGQPALSSPTWERAQPNAKTAFWCRSSVGDEPMKATPCHPQHVPRHGASGSRHPPCGAGSQQVQWLPRCESQNEQPRTRQQQEVAPKR